MCLMSTVSTGISESALLKIKQMLYMLGVIDANICEPGAIAPPALQDEGQYHLCFLNGSLVGLHTNPPRLISDVKGLRRRGMLFKFCGIFYEATTRSIHMNCDEGRLCRPLIIIDEATGKPRFDPSEHSKMIKRTNGYHAFMHKNKEKRD